MSVRMNWMYIRAVVIDLGLIVYVYIIYYSEDMDIVIMCSL